MVRAAVTGGIAVYSAHTSLDSAPNGVSDVLAGLLGLRKTRPLQPAAGWPAGYGLGRVGDLPVRMKVREAAGRIKSALGLGTVRLTGDPERTVTRVAVCGGSGADLIDDALAAAAGLYVTGDVKYHDALKAVELGLAILDVGHFASEYIVVPRFAERLSAAFKKKGWTVKVHVSKVQGEPWSYI